MTDFWFAQLVYGIVFTKERNTGEGIFFLLWGRDRLNLGSFNAINLVINTRKFYKLIGILEVRNSVWILGGSLTFRL